MQIPISLRLETADGRSIEEYRIRDGAVEVRQIHGFACAPCEWKRLTSAELTDHVNRKTVLAQWLRRRLGWRRLLQACVADQDLSCFQAADPAADRHAA